MTPEHSPSGARLIGDVAELLLGRTPAPRAGDGSGRVFVGLAELGGQHQATRRVSTDEGTAIVLQPGDVVVARLSNIGASTLVEDDHLAGGVLGRECVALRPNDPTITGNWLYLWTLTDHFQQQVRRSTSGAAMPRLDAKALRNFLVPIPDLMTQVAIQQAHDRFDSSVEELQQLLSDVTELRALELNIAVADSVESARLIETDGGEDA